MTSQAVSDKKSSTLKPRHLKVSLGKLPKCDGVQIVDDAKLMVHDCLKDIDRDQFPPQLFVLWLTPEFQMNEEPEPYQEFVSCIHQELNRSGFGNVPLIGTSTAAVVFDAEVSYKGAVLLCLASTAMSVRTAVIPNVTDSPGMSAHALLEGLGLRDESVVDARSHRFLMTYLPGHSVELDPSKYVAPQIVSELNRTCGRQRLHMFGGVSSAGMEAGVGSQILNGQVFRNAIVGALITSQVAYGIGISHGLKPTEKKVTISRLSDGGKSIAHFAEGHPKSILDQFPNAVFCEPNTVSHPVVIVPRSHNGCLRTQRIANVGQSLQIMVPDSHRVRYSVLKLERWVRRNFHISRENIALVLAIGCVSRLRKLSEPGFEIENDLYHAAKRFPNSVRVGCYLDGEIGVNTSGNSVFGNWSLAEAILADAFAPRSDLQLGFDALSIHMHNAMSARSVSDANASSLKCILAAGFSAAMISLVYDDNGRKWIIGQDALGGVWPETILPDTIREISGDDILACVYASKKAEIVVNCAADERCDQDTVRKSGVKNFYAAPLINRLGEVIGILQVDLSDAKQLPLPEERRVILQTLAEFVGAAMSHAISAEETELDKRLDGIFEESLQKQTIDAGVGYFVRQAAITMGANAHARLMSHDGKKLILVGDGRGDYFKVAREHRRVIEYDDATPTTTVLVDRKDHVVNDAETSPIAARIRNRYPADHPIGVQLRKMRAFGDFLIHSPSSPALGVVCFDSPEAWFFTPSRQRCLQSIGWRLAQLVSTLEEKEGHQGAITVLRFLKNMTPPDFEGRNIYEALNNQVDKIREAANADVVSCYLKCKIQERYVLRAQSGWHNRKWENAAWFTEDRGLSGELITHPEPFYIPDRLALKQFPGRYLNDMFEVPANEDETYEMIALPLNFRGQRLGLLTMYRKRAAKSEGDSTGFATKEPAILKEAADGFSAFVYAVRQADLSRWKEEELNRHRAITKRLELLPSDGNLKKILDAGANAIIEEYRASVCAVYLGSSSEQLILASAALRPANQQPGKPPDLIDRGIVWEAFVGRHITFERLPMTAQQRDRELVVKENLIWRVAIPLIAGGQCYGVIDLSWQDARPITDRGILPHHDENLLQAMSNLVAESIRRYKSRMIAMTAKRADQTLSGLAGFLVVKFHAIRRYHYELDASSSYLETPNLEPAKEQEEKKRHRDKLKQFERFLNEATALAQILQQREVRACNLFNLVRNLVMTWDPDEKHALNEPIALSTWLQKADVVCNEARLTEILRLLLSNAITAVAKVRNPDISISLDYDNHRDHYLILISDNGPGITLGDFKRYIAGEELDKQRGHGCGLFLANLMCEVDGGQLELESEGRVGLQDRTTLVISVQRVGGAH